MKHLLSKKKYSIFILIFIFIPFVSFAQINNTLDSNLQQGLNIINGKNFNTPDIGAQNITSNNINADPLRINDSGSGGSFSNQYTPITPGGVSFFEGGSFEDMLEKIFKISIYATVMLAVVMIIWGGVEYMGSESIFKKGAGKEKIFSALAGLFIALISILLLATILPSGGSGDAFRINIFQTSGGGQ